MAKRMGKGEDFGPTDPESIHRRVWAIDTKSMGKMEAAEFAFLRVHASAEDLKHLDYLLKQFELERTVGDAVERAFKKREKEINALFMKKALLDHRPKTA